MPHIHSKISTKSTFVKWSIRSTAMAVTILADTQICGCVNIVLVSFLFSSFDSGVDSVYDEEESEPVSVLNPLSPKSDQHQISPCNINAL